ncbi:ribosomal protein L15 [Tuber magnatum]|uniref:Ribosomal protein L15 n=1 Tax=Tuber magnatum TaxID=42249 RepID=A0A317SR76_9PEZI|nr:ribosomal protein L15 [Tuber magnatum]
MPLLPTFSRTVGLALRPNCHPPVRILSGVQLQQCRFVSILGDLRDVRASFKKRIRRGRGPSSGKGKTSGRGHKGQKQHGKVPAGFQGGQTPLHITHPEKGEANLFALEMSPLNLDRLQIWIDQGRIDPAKPITFKELVDTRCLHGIKDGVKLLARGKQVFKTPIDITVSRASREAIKAVEDAGGKIVTRFFNKNGVRAVVHPERYPPDVRLANPTARRDIEYYRDPEHRGYLAHTLDEGESPSLFWRAPGKAKNVLSKEQLQKKKDKQANKLF